MPTSRYDDRENPRDQGYEDDQGRRNRRFQKEERWSGRDSDESRWPQRERDFNRYAGLDTGEDYTRIAEVNYAGKGPRGYQRSDERIKEDVCEALTQDPRIDASDIDVQVNAGEVILRGMVEDRRMKRIAEDVAEVCTGVKDVRNELRITSHMQSQSENHSQAPNAALQRKERPKALQ